MSGAATTTTKSVLTFVWGQELRTREDFVGRQYYQLRLEAEGGLPGERRELGKEVDLENVRTMRFGDRVLMEIKGRRAEFCFEGLGRDFSHSLNQEIQEEEEHIWRQKTLGLGQIKRKVPEGWAGRCESGYKEKARHRS